MLPLWYQCFPYPILQFEYPSVAVVDYDDEDIIYAAWYYMMQNYYRG